MPSVPHPSATTDPAEQARQAAEAFRAAYGGPPTLAAQAPGRVNLIGEHTDYNGGFVLPLAIQRQTLVLATPRDDRTIRLRSAALGGEAVIDLDQPINPGEPAWANYPRGVVAGWLDQFPLSTGFDALLDTNIPIGAGLSSSASLTVATATLLESLTGVAISELDRALLAQQAEHRFAGMPCGIMDHLASSSAQAGHALLIDCRFQAVTQVPVPDALAVIIADSNAGHELVDSAYAQRRSQCEAAAKAMGIRDLRDATPAMLDSAQSTLDPLVYRRARHVITENQRVLDTVAGLERSDWPMVGRCLYDSHASMRDDFEITTPELDTLVDLAAAIGPDGGVIGARMTGGGFGGCTVTLAKADRAGTIREQLAEGYRATTGRDATIFQTRPARGACALDLAQLL